MAKADLEKFNQVVLRNPALQEKLRNSSDLKAFTEMVVKLGQQEGCSFTADDVAEQLATNSQATSADRELSDKELELASGGYSWGSSYWCGGCGKTSATSVQPPS